MESALRLSHTLGTHIEDYLEINSEFGIARITVSGRIKGITVGKMHEDEKATVLAIRRGNRVILEPSDKEQISEGDILIVAGRDEDLKDLPNM